LPGIDRRRESSSARAALQILSLFSIARPTLGVSEIAREMNIPKSSAFRLTTTLASEGFLAQTDDHRLTLGLRLHDLGEVVARNHILYGPALSALIDIRNKTGESAHLAVLNGIDVIHIERLGNEYILKITGGKGYHSPRHATSTGKLLLAYSPQSVQEAAILAGLPKLASRTITDPDKFRAELAQVRERGYSLCESEFVEDVKSVSVPLFNSARKVLAALCVVGEPRRLTDVRIASITLLLKRVSATLAQHELLHA
jgi:DNA-binding IclR family transcriptional regulator